MLTNRKNPIKNPSSHDYTDYTDEELLTLACHGDSEAQECIIIRYKNLVRAKARPYFLVGADRDDIIQEGMIGLYKAMRDYDTGKNASFSSFAELCVTRQIITAIKSATRNKHMPLNTYISFSLPTNADEGVRTVEDIVSHETASDPEEIFIGKENYEQVLAMIDKLLSNYEYDVLVSYLDGDSYQEISEKLGTHPKSVDNALQRIKRKLGESVGMMEN